MERNVARSDAPAAHLPRDEPGRASWKHNACRDLRASAGGHGLLFQAEYGSEGFRVTGPGLNSGPAPLQAGGPNHTI